jgi:SNF2 family DNA or RNA helicase
VFYAYKHDLNYIKERFNGAVEMGGDAIERWNRGEISLLLCHPASAGHGLNLQDGGHIAVWYGLPWSLELYMQANARLHRMGQTQSVILHHILCEDTLDARVMAALERKNTTQRELLDALKEYLNDEKTR